MKRFHRVAAFILAGGASSRMGQDKGLLEFSGVPLIVHSASLIEPLVADVTVVGSPQLYTVLGLSAIPDKGVANEAIKSSDGPLTGIVTALGETRKPWNLILACDLPYMTAAWVEWLLSRALRSEAQVVIPRSERGFEPLAAVYRRDSGPPLADALARGVRKVTEAIGELKLDFVDQREWRRLDPRGLVLKNMNTPADYKEALRWWNAERLSEFTHLRKSRLLRNRKRRSAPRPHR